MDRSDWRLFQKSHIDGQQKYEKMLKITNHQGNEKWKSQNLTLILTHSNS